MTNPLSVYLPSNTSIPSNQHHLNTRLAPHPITLTLIHSLTQTNGKRDKLQSPEILINTLKYFNNSNETKEKKLLLLLLFSYVPYSPFTISLLELYPFIHTLFLWFNNFICFHLKSLFHLSYISSNYIQFTWNFFLSFHEHPWPAHYPVCRPHHYAFFIILCN